MDNEDYTVIKEYLSTHVGGEVNLVRNTETGIAYLCLKNQRKRNAITGKMMVDFRDCVEILEKWDAGKAVIIYGEGVNFCSGGDLNFARKTGNPVGAHRMSTWMQETLRRLQNLALLSVCVIHGPTLGGGAEISIFADYILSTNDLQYGFVHGKMGIITAWGGATRLTQKIGASKALDLLVTSKILSAQECLEAGIVDGIIGGDNTLEAATEWLKPRIQHHPEIIRAFKDVVTAANGSNYDKALEYEKKRFIPFWGSTINLEALNQHIKHIKHMEL